MKRLVILGTLVAALAAGGAAAAVGAVCSFPVTAEPVSQNLRLRYHYDDAGNAYEVAGPLIARVTNTSTGKSVVRNLSGQGTVLFGPDGSWDAVVNGGFLILFRAGDEPANALLFFQGHTVLQGLPTGEKTLVSYTGQGENVCETLA